MGLEWKEYSLLGRDSLGSAGRSAGRVGRTFPLRRRLSTQYEKKGEVEGMMRGCIFRVRVSASVERRTTTLQLVRRRVEIYLSYHDGLMC